MIKKLLIAILPLALLFACSGPFVPEKGIVSETKTDTGEKKIQVSEWGNTVAAAKKEGRLTVYTSYEPSVNDYIKKAFQDKFGIEIEYRVGTGPLVIPKLVAERQAGLYLGDIFLGGTDPILLMLKPAGGITPLKEYLFLPEVLDASLWYKGTLPWVDTEKRWIVQTKASTEPGEVVINTNSVGKGELSSYHDLLQLKYKGKINIYDPTLPGRGNKWFISNLIMQNLDLDYMKALAKQDIFITRDIRLQVEWVAQGKHFVSMLPRSAIFRDFYQAGAPVDYISLKESKQMLGGGTSGVAVIDRQTHPAAAKLFANWYLSKEGQTVFSKAYMYQTFRLDVPVDHLDSKMLRDPKIDYPIETEDFLKRGQEFTAAAKEVFGPLLR